MDYHIYAKLSKMAFWVAMLSMALVFVPGIGIEAYGARRWIKIPIFGTTKVIRVYENCNCCFYSSIDM